MKQFLFLLLLIAGRIAADPDVDMDEKTPDDDTSGGGDDGMEEDEGDPGDDYVDEIRDQVEGPRNDTDDDREKRQTYHNGVSQGNAIALQRLYSKLYWLGCRGYYCYKNHCPKLYMEGNDWSRCWGTVFNIYRARGRGYVKVGDVVGIYFPYHRKWFSMRGGSYGHKSTCPGRYSYDYGFSHSRKWYECYGEVYKIYARGKRVGDVIYNYDDIMLYYVRGNKYVSLVHDSRADLRTCPGRYRPPHSSKYDVCYGQVFQLWKRSY